MMALLLCPFPFFLPVVCLACGGWCWCCCLVVGSGYDVESFYFRVKGFRVKKNRVTVKGGSTEQLQTLANLGFPPMLTPR